jgi:hypothetical protein
MFHSNDLMVFTPLMIYRVMGVTSLTSGSELLKSVAGSLDDEARSEEVSVTAFQAETASGG